MKTKYSFLLVGLLLVAVPFILINVDLGFEANAMTAFMALVAAPSGIVLIIASIVMMIRNK